MNQNRKNFIWNMIGLSLNAFNSLFFLIIVKRINGLDVAGVFSYGFAVASLIALVALYFSRVYQVTNVSISDKSFIKFRFYSCSLGLLLSVIIAFVSSSNITDALVIVLLCLFRIIESFADSFYGIMHKNNRLDYVGKSMTLKAIIGLFLLIVIDYYSKDIILSILALPLVNVFGVCIDYYNSNKFIVNKLHSKITDYKDILKQSASICSFSMLAVLFLNLQKYIIGIMNLDSISALFGIIVMPATVLSLCGQYLINPYINRLDSLKSNIIEFKNMVKRLSLILFGFGVLILLVLYIFGINIMELLYDINLSQYVFYILLIVFSSIFYSITCIFSSAMTILEQNTIQFIEFLFITIFSIILSIILLKVYGLTGAVYSYCISMIIHTILYTILFNFSINKWGGRKS